jgi:putative beta-lysine N-acetyltransferase
MDTIENFLGSTIQHGHHNNRIYLMQLSSNNIKELLSKLDELAHRHGYTKILARIPAGQWHSFEHAGYIKEAVIPGFFQGSTDGFFIAKFFDTQRGLDAPEDQLQKLIAGNTEPLHGQGTELLSTGHIAICSPADAPAMSAIYRNTFASYPFPVTDPAYIQKMMAEDVRYYCVREEEQIVALAAAEIDTTHKNVEMTDFATLPMWRGQGLAETLLQHMNEAMSLEGLQTAYTIARAQSPGINHVFKRCGYSYAGFLANNTQISGTIQSMTVWYKTL